MPDLETQLHIHRRFTADFTAVRALLRRVEAMRTQSKRARQLGEPAFPFVNNRREAHAPSTIEAVVSTLAI
jgi:hypothetical protein